LFRKLNEKTTQIPEFFVKTLILGDDLQSEVGDLPEIILLFSYTTLIVPQTVCLEHHG
jgi:hypothetical protein